MKTRRVDKIGDRVELECIDPRQAKRGVIVALHARKQITVRFADGTVGQFAPRDLRRLNTRPQ